MTSVLVMNASTVTGSGQAGSATVTAATAASATVMRTDLMPRR
jgi:hypothetical protein